MFYDRGAKRQTKDTSGGVQIARVGGYTSETRRLDRSTHRSLDPVRCGHFKTEAMNPPHPHGDIPAPVRWTALQREMFHRNRASSGSDRPYQTQWHCTISGRAPVELLSLHLRRFHDRHRAVLAARPEGFSPTVDPRPIEIEMHDEGTTGEDLERTLRRLWIRGVDLAAGDAPVRLELHRGPVDDTLIITAHHAYIDGGSRGILLREVLAPAFRGEQQPLAAPAPDFAVFARWMEEQGSSDAVLRFWAECFEGAEVAGGIGWLEIGPCGDRSAGYGIARRTIGIDATARIHGVLRECGVRPSTASHVAVGLLLASGAGAPSAAFGSVRAMRDVPVEGVRDVVANLVNIVGVRVDAGLDRSMRELLVETRGRDADGKSRSGVALHDLQRLARLGTGLPLELLVVHADATFTETALRGIGSDRVRRAELRQQPAMPVVVSIGFGSTVEISVQWDASRIDRRRAESLADRLAHLLEQFGGDPDRRWSELLCATPEDLEAVRRVGDGGVPEWSEGRLDDAFLAACERHGSATAVTDLATSVDYRGLKERALRVAAALDGCGADRSRPVGICMPRDVLLPACHLACWLSGRFFVPLDPELPEDRLQMLASEAGVAVVIAGPGQAALWDAQVRSGLHRIDPAGELPAATSPSDDRSSSDIAYAFFTSGSTGKPKLALVEHRGALNYLRGLAAFCGFSETVRSVQLTPVGFDPSIIEIHLPFLTGGVVGVVPPGMHVDFERIAETAGSLRANYMTLVPSVLTRLVERARTWPADRLATVRVVACGGEAMPPALPAAFDEVLGARGARLLNAYGPTEASIGVTSVFLDRSSPNPAPIGRAMPGNRLRVVDAALRTLPIGAHGELVISGNQVGRGYHGDPAQTASRFVQLPDVEGLSYRTGDRASLDDDGVVWFHGRLDFQFKVRGMRVEAGEIERAMTEVAGIRTAVAWYVGDGVERKVVGYFDADAEHAGAEAILRLKQRLREHLKSRLPAQVVPGAFIAMSDWPLTANAKIDRKRLPAPADGDLVLAAPKARRTTTVAEAQLRARVAEIFAEILRANDVDSATSFFDAGGDSLSAVLLVDRLQREFGVTVAVADFLRDPTPTAVALSLLAGGATASIEPVVPILPSEASATLHCFPGVGGLAAFTYLPLAGALRGDCRCLGYQLPGAADGEEPTYSLTRAAALRTPHVLEQSAGRPIHLIGFSFGGILALEVAAQLEEAGHEVAGVTLLDSAPIRNRDRIFRLGRACMRSLGISRASRSNRKLDELAGVRTVRGADLGAVERRLRRVMDCAGLSLAWHRIRSVRCPIDVVLSNGVDVSAEDVTDAAACERWKRYSSAPVRVVRTAATHNGLVRNEGVSIVADTVRRQLSSRAARQPRP